MPLLWTTDGTKMPEYTKSLLNKRHLLVRKAIITKNKLPSIVVCCQKPLPFLKISIQHAGTDGQTAQLQIEIITQTTKGLFLEVTEVKGNSTFHSFRPQVWIKISTFSNWSKKWKLGPDSQSLGDIWAYGFGSGLSLLLTNLDFLWICFLSGFFPSVSYNIKQLVLSVWRQTSWRVWSQTK